MIFIKKVKEIIVPAEAKTQFEGRYKIEAVREDGSRRLLADWFPNLVTNAGMDYLSGVSGNYTAYCVVGSGNTVPAFTDTALTTLVGVTTSAVSNTITAAAVAPYVGTRTAVYSFLAGVATGNLAEVGVGISSTALFSRALILDNVGNPTTITVLSNEALYVTYQLNQYVPVADVTGSVVIAGITYAYTLRAANATSATYWAVNPGEPSSLAFMQIGNGAISTVTGVPSGTFSSANNNSTAAYSAGSYTYTGTSVYDITNNSIPLISVLYMVMGPYYNSRGAYQVGLTPGIPKDSTHVLTLNCSASWARYP